MKNHTNKTKATSKIPPPPTIEAGYDAIIAYHQKYSMAELEKAGHLKKPPLKKTDGMAAAATFELLCNKGLHLSLTPKDCKQLSYLATRFNVEVEILVGKWIRHCLREELKAIREIASSYPKRTKEG